MACLPRGCLTSSQEHESLTNDMDYFWKKFEGELLDQQFQLHNYLGVSETGAMFRTQLEGREEPVLIKIIRSGSEGSERIISSWSIAKELQHPNLVRVYASSLSNLGGLRVAYAVTEYPDGKLASVLQEHCLTKEEALELVRDCAEGLVYLHSRNYVHTHVRPTDIVAVNEVTKLSSDYLVKVGERGVANIPDPHDAPEVESTGFSWRSDIWSLGATLFEALTGTLPQRVTEPGLMGIPAPYAEIVQHCLQSKPGRRWTAIQIVAFLKRSLVTQAALVGQHMVDKERQPSKGSKIRAATLRPATLTLIMLLGIGGLVTAMLHRAKDVSAKAPFGAAPEQAESPVPKKAGVERVSTSKVVEAPEPSQKVPSTVKSPANARPIWHVVVFTYSRAGRAEQKVAEINRLWPDFPARVLNGGPPYVVIVGAEKRRDAALMLRDRLLASGFPPDSYVQNFSE